MEKIQNFDDVLKINGTTNQPTFSEISDEKDPETGLSERDFYKSEWQWAEVAKAYNKESDPKYKADWTNPSHYKYYPWTEIEKDSSQPSGFAFSNTDYNDTSTSADVGSRHAFSNSKDVMDALKKFGEIYIKTRMA